MNPYQKKLFDELSNEIKKLEEQKKSIGIILYYLYEEQKKQASKILEEIPSSGAETDNDGYGGD